MVDDSKCEEESSSLRLAELCKSGEIGDGIISTWIGNSDARANMHTRTFNLARIPRIEWDIDHFRPIKGIKDFYELKWKAEGKQFRAAGYFYHGYFVMVLGFTHKDQVYDPPRWKEIIKRRRKEVGDGNWKIVEFEP